MKERKDNKPLIAEKAADWALKIEEDLSPRQEDELVKWLESHESAPDLLAKSQKTWKRFEILNPKHFEMSNTGLEKKNRKTRSARIHTNRWTFIASAAAAIAIIGISLLLIKQSKDPRTDSTRSLSYAEADFYELEDGSTVDLNKGAQVLCKYSPNRREFWVESGEAYFTVAKDPQRPFDVHAGETQLRATGTQFNVKYEGPSVEVLVTEGVVSLSIVKPKKTDTRSPEIDTRQTQQKLTQNQKAVVHRSDTVNHGYVIQEVGEKEVSDILVWKPVTFTFDSTPLSEVVKSFNRHNDAQLIIEDREIESLKIVATFRSNKLEGFISLLQATSNVVAHREGNKIKLSSRAN